MSTILLKNPFEYSCPSRNLDEHLALSLGLEDFFSTLIPREVLDAMRCPAGYQGPWGLCDSQKKSDTTVCSEKDKFQVNLEVQQFKPEEITVKVSENTITVEGKQEEKEDVYGSVSRHFVRRYVLPKDHDVDKVESKLSSDGVLTITAPKINKTDVEEARSIPVIQTGQPTKATEKKEEEAKEEEKN